MLFNILHKCVNETTNNLICVLKLLANIPDKNDANKQLINEHAIRFKFIFSNENIKCHCAGHFDTWERMSKTRFTKRPSHERKWMACSAIHARAKKIKLSWSDKLLQATSWRRAQWLGRRSLAGGLSLIWSIRLIYGWHLNTSWVKCPQWVYLPGQLSLPSSWVCKWLVMYVMTWITRVATIKRQIRAAYCC